VVQSVLGCVKFSKGDFAKMCASSRPDYRGCSLINERYDKPNGPVYECFSSAGLQQNFPRL